MDRGRESVMKEIMKGMTKKEIVLDCLHIAWYLIWRWAVSLVGFFGFFYLFAMITGGE